MADVISQVKWTAEQDVDPRNLGISLTYTVVNAAT